MLKKQEGFTVVEILIGIGIFGVVMPTILFAIVSLNGVNDRAGDLTNANIIAEKKFETLRNEGYNSLLVGSYDFTNELDESYGSPKSASYTVTIPETGKKHVTINIQYTANDSLKDLYYRMLISELGVAQ